MSAQPIRYHFAEMLDDMLLLWAHHQAMTHGGDGWTIIVSPRWRELAERYALRPDRFELREEAGDDTIMFRRGQEGITFCAKALPVDSELDHIDNAWVIVP